MGPAKPGSDLNPAYGAAISAAVPQATHHECIFHALQCWQAEVRKGYREQHPKAVELGWPPAGLAELAPRP